MGREVHVTVAAQFGAHGRREAGLEVYGCEVRARRRGRENLLGLAAGVAEARDVGLTFGLSVPADERAGAGRRPLRNSSGPPTVLGAGGGGDSLVAVREDRVGQHRQHVRGGLAPLEFSPQHRERRGRRQADDLVADDERARGPLTDGGRRLGEHGERDVLQRAVGDDHQALRAQFGGDRGEHDPAQLGPARGSSASARAARARRCSAVSPLCGGRLRAVSSS